MPRPSRARRILMWTGAGLFIAILACWATSLLYVIVVFPTSNLAASMDHRGISVLIAKLHPGLVNPVMDPSRIERNRFNEYPRSWFEWPRIRDHFDFHHRSWDSARDLFMPFWLLLLLTAIPTAWLWHRDRRRIRPGCCLRCGYDLTGNTSGVCSECGLAKPPPAIV